MPPLVAGMKSDSRLLKIQAIRALRRFGGGPFEFVVMHFLRNPLIVIAILAATLPLWPGNSHPCISLPLLR